jgi:hypothetical protein
MKTNDIWTPHDIYGFARSRDELPADSVVQIPESLRRDLHYTLLIHTIRDGQDRACTIVYDSRSEQYEMGERYSRTRRPVGVAITRSEDYALNALTFSADDMETCVASTLPCYLLTPFRQYLVVPRFTECRGALVKGSYEEVRLHDLTQEAVMKTCRKHGLAYFEGRHGLLRRVC